jgi:hypothetical protein
MQSERVLAWHAGCQGSLCGAASARLDMAQLGFSAIGLFALASSWIVSHTAPPCVCVPWCCKRHSIATLLRARAPGLRALLVGHLWYWCVVLRDGELRPDALRHLLWLLLPSGRCPAGHVTTTAATAYALPGPAGSTRTARTTRTASATRRRRRTTLLVVDRRHQLGRDPAQSDNIQRIQTCIRSQTYLMLGT